MDRNKWLWVFVLFAFLNLLFAALTLYDVLNLDILIVNIIRAILVIITLLALVMAFLVKK